MKLDLTRICVFESDILREIKEATKVSLEITSNSIRVKVFIDDTHSKFIRMTLEDSRGGTSNNFDYYPNHLHPSNLFKGEIKMVAVEAWKNLKND